MTDKRPESPRPADTRVAASGHQEVRCAVRFPLTLSVQLSTGEEDLAGTTRNVSASGVLFALEKDVRVGSDISFSLRMPHSILGSPQDVLSPLQGTCGTLLLKSQRVSRCSDYR